MAKKAKAVKKEVQEVIVLVHDPILGSRYELKEVEVDESEFFQHLGIDITPELKRILTEEIKKAIDEQ